MTRSMFAALFIAAVMLTAVEAATPPAVPGATPAPGETSAPGATPAPGVTSAPGATPAPGLTSAPGATPAPLLIEYYCDKTAKTFTYNFTKIQQPGSSYALAPQATTLGNLSSNATSKPTCATKFTAFPNTTAAVNGTLTQCTQFATDSMMYLYIMKTTLDKKVIGGTGFGKYELPCEIADGKKVQIKKTFADKAPTPPKNQLPDILKMTVENADHTSIVVGQRLNVKIEVVHSDPSNYYLRIEECSAASDAGGTNKFPLITGEKSVEPDVTLTNQSLGSPATGADHAINFHMFAFKFYNVDNVVLTCTVKVCTTAGTCKAPTRRRRSSNDVSVGVASTSFTVHEKNEISSGQTLRMPSLAVVSSALALLYATVM